MLPVLLPQLLECCKFTEADKMSMTATKEEGLAKMRQGENLRDRDGVVDDEDEDYEISEDIYSTTLRKSAAFTLQRFS